MTKTAYNIQIKVYVSVAVFDYKIVDSDVLLVLFPYGVSQIQPGVSSHPCSPYLST